MLEKSLQDLGAGRSVLADKHGVLIAGNKTLQTAVEAGFEDAIVVESDGTRLVIVKRTDLDLSTDEKAKQLAIADNRVGQISLEWDADVLADLAGEVDLSGFFFPNELSALLEAETNNQANSDSGAAAIGSGNGALSEAFLVPPFSVLDARQGYWQKRKKQWLDLGIQSELGRGGG